MGAATAEQNGEDIDGTSQLDSAASSFSSSSTSHRNFLSQWETEPSVIQAYNNFLAQGVLELEAKQNAPINYCSTEILLFLGVGHRRSDR